MLNLPVEINENILLNVDSRTRFALGLEPDARRMFLEGGPLSVLAFILNDGGDIKSLLRIKRYIPSGMAIYQAIMTENISLIKRVCTVWQSKTSNAGFITSWHKGFVWGINNISPTQKLNQHEYNRIYFEMGLLDKIDLSIHNPFCDFRYVDLDIYAKRYHYLPYTNTLSTDDLFILNIMRNQRDLAFQLVENDNKINFLSCLKCCIEAGVYKLPINLFKKYRHKYNLPNEKLEAFLVQQRNIDALKYFNARMFDLHQALSIGDTGTVNKLLIEKRRKTVSAMGRYYGLDALQAAEINVNSQIRLGEAGEWIGFEEDRWQRIESIPLGGGKNTAICVETIAEKIKSGKITDVRHILTLDHRVYRSLLPLILERFGCEVIIEWGMKFTLLSEDIPHENIKPVIQALAALLDYGYETMAFGVSSCAIYAAKKTIYYHTYCSDLWSGYRTNYRGSREDVSREIAGIHVINALKVYLDMTAK